MREDDRSELPGYTDIARLLHQAGVETAVAEAHGIITGVLCAPRGAHVAWLNLVLAQTPATAEVESALRGLHRRTHEHLSGLECDFAPLLPGDDYSLAAQIEGLSEWCRGYLLGLHAGGVADPNTIAGDAGEIIRDIGRIAEAELDPDLAEEAEARALAEIVEYLRVGVQLVYEEFQPPSASPGK